MTWSDPLTTLDVPIDRLPPRVLLSWAATARGAAFGGYNIYRRPRGTPVYPWQKIGAISVPTGYSAAVVEAQHNSFVDYESGWGVTLTRWVSGFDYDIRVVDATTGLESVAGTTLSVNDVPPGTKSSWVVCNNAPWLNVPVFVHENSVDQVPGSITSSSTARANVQDYDLHGRDGGFTRTRKGVPPREIALTFEQVGFPAGDVFDVHRAASVSGRQLALLETRGDAHYGVLEYPNVTRGNTPKISGTASFVTVGPIPFAADYNRPAAIVLNGTTQYAATASATSQNPLAQPFAVMVCGVFANHATDVYLSDGTVAASGVGSFGFYCPSLGQMRFRVHGAGGAVDVTSTSAVWFDGKPHVAIAIFDGTNLSLYLDGVLAAGPTLATSVGSISNNVAFTAGADNGGASGFTASALQAWGLWGQAAWPSGVSVALTSTDAMNISRYLLGYWGYRMPGGAALLYNCADSRCWNGIDTNLKDLAGLQQQATLTAAPSTRGIPGQLGGLGQDLADASFTRDGSVHGPTSRERTLSPGR